MKKNCKWLLAALVAVGTVIGLVIAYFCKKRNEASEIDEDDFEDEDDFDLDGDLKPVAERGYVPLNKSADTSNHKTEPEPDGSEEGDLSEAADEEDVAAEKPDEDPDKKANEEEAADDGQN